MSINFPNSPNLNDIAQVGNSFYIWNGRSWIGYSTSLSSGIGIKDDDVFSGTAATINFGDNLTVDFSDGVATIDATGGGGGGESYWTETSAGIHTLSNVGIGTTNPTSALTVIGSGTSTSQLYVTGASTFIGNIRIGEDFSTNHEIRLGGSGYLIYAQPNITLKTQYSAGKVILQGHYGVEARTLNNQLVAYFASNPANIGYVELYYQGSKKFETTSAGATVTGTITATSFVGALTGTATSTTNIPNLTGDITSVNNVTDIATGAIVNADINASAAIADTKLATIATAGKVSNSATTATNANTASAIVTRDASGNFSAGTITATSFVGALTGTATSTTNIPDLTGDIISVNNVTAIATGAIVNADINANAAIADTKLATIATAGKVSNSATTATNANTASAIVARDASGNFSAGTITATSITGNGSNITFVGAGAVSRTLLNKFSEIVNVDDFGAVGNGTTDDTISFQAALNYLYDTNKGGILRLKEGSRYRINGIINVLSNCTIEGTISNPGQLWNTLDGKRFNYKANPGLILGTNAQFVLYSASTIKNCSIISGAVWDWGASSDHSSTEVVPFISSWNNYLPAITTPSDGSADSLVQNCAIAGFSYAIQTNSTSSNRFTARDVLIDCLNGISVEQSGDLGKLENCHAWPFVTTNEQYNNGITADNIAAAQIRSGTAFRFGNTGVGVDWGKMTNCFCFGYSIGFNIDKTRTVTLIGCGADNRIPNVGSIGFKISPQFEANLIGCQVAACDYGYYVDTSVVSGTYNKQYYVKFSGCSVWDTPQAGMFVKSGIVVVEGCSFRINGGPSQSASTYPIGIYFDYDAYISYTTFNRCVINGCLFRGSSNIPAIRYRTTSGGSWVSGAFTNLTVGYNTFLNNTPRISPQF